MAKIYDSFLWWCVLWLPCDEKLDFAFFLAHKLDSPLQEYFWDSLVAPETFPTTPWDIAHQKHAYIALILDTLTHGQPAHF